MSRSAGIYAQALYGLVKDEGNPDATQEQLCALRESFRAEPDFLRLLANHSLSKQERVRILDDSFRGKIEPYLLNFLKLLTENGEIRLFSEICSAYIDLYDQEHNILPVQAVSAVEMTEDQKQRLSDKLCQITGKTVRISYRIDPELIGGVRLDYDGKRVDGSVKSRLDAVRNLLKSS